VIVFCWFAYFLACLGRYNYNACIIEIIAEYGVSRVEAGTVSSFFFFPYMIGQVVYAALTRRVNSVVLIGGAFVLSAGINFFMPFAGPLAGMRILWFLNGLVQSALWPNMINVLTTMLPAKKLTSGMVVVNTTGAAGSAGALLISAACLKWLPWRFAFFIPAALLLVFGVIWFLGMTGLRREDRNSAPEGPTGPRPGNYRVLIAGGFLFAVVAAAANGFLRDGINVWLPMYMYDTFKVESALAVFLSVIIPVSQIGGALFSKKVYDACRGPFPTAMIFYATALLSVLVIILGGGTSIVLTSLCFAVCAAMMTSVNTALVTFYPLVFRSRGLTAFASGHINAFVYTGSIAAASGFGIAADLSGWSAVLGLMAGAAAVSIVFCLAGWKQSAGKR
jgi:OPA family glycerol-3-phosphate transporter-like MFS transporter